MIGAPISILSIVNIIQSCYFLVIYPMHSVPNLRSKLQSRCTVRYDDDKDDEDCG